MVVMIGSYSTCVAKESVVVLVPSYALVSSGYASPCSLVIICWTVDYADRNGVARGCLGDIDIFSIRAHSLCEQRRSVLKAT